MSQTDQASYGFKLDVAQAGQLADIGPHRIDSFAAEEALDFGKGLKRGTDPDKQCLLVDSDADSFLGVAVFTHAREQGFSPAATPSSTGSRYEVGDTVNVLREGRVYVKAIATVAAGDDAYLDVATGDFTNDDTYDVVGPVGKFQSSGAADAIVSLDLIR